MAVLIKLGDLASQLAFEHGEQGPFNSIWYLYQLIQCVKEIRYDKLGYVKTVEIELGEDMTIPLPDDYIDWVKLGRRKGSSRVETMTVNRNMVSTPPTLEAGYSEPGYKFHNFDGDGTHYGQLYGYGGGNHGGGHFKEDRDNNQILLDSDVNADFIYLEYITDGVAPCGATTIHPYAEDTLLRYVDWRKARKKYGMAAAETQMAKREYYNASRLLTRRLNPFSKKQFLEMWRSYYGMAIRS